MRRLFAALRRLIALERAQIALGAVVQDAISTVIIPKLQKMADNERTPEEKERFEALIREYAEYADPRNPKSRQWADIASASFNENARRMGIPPALAEDGAQNAASDFYTLDHKRVFGGFDPVNGPTALARYWNTIMHNRAFAQFQRIKREQVRTQQPTVEDEGDVFKTIPSRGIDESMYRDILEDLSDYVHAHARSYGHAGQYAPQVFDRWFEIVEKGGASSVNMTKDVYEPVMREMAQKGEDVPSRTMISEAWPAVKKMVVRFFSDELDMEVYKEIKKRLKMSSEAVITVETFRRKVARWILGL